MYVITFFFITVNFVPPIPKTTKAQWYHGTLSRDEAVYILNKYCKSHSITSTDGVFLVRYSNKHTGTYVLTMLCDNSAFNFIIRKEVMAFSNLFKLKYTDCFI